jgi:LysM repeat protein
MNYGKNSIFSRIARSIIFFLLAWFFLAVIGPNAYAQEYLEYQIKEGDCLWTIAHKFQLSIQEVAEANDIDEEEILCPGSLLVIPKDQADNSNEKKVTTTIVHKVKKGESLWDIAQQYRLSLDKISSVNDLRKPDSLYIGQEINIPIENQKEAQQNQSAELSFEPEESSYKTMSTSLNQEFRESFIETDYTVKPGESLWAIAQNYHISLKELSKINNLEDEEKLSIGQIIKIPIPSLSKDNTMKDDDKEDQIQYDWIEHIVESGENISLIAQKYHMPIETLCKLNNIDKEDYVYPGQRIKIKATEKAESIYVADRSITNEEKEEVIENAASPQEELKPVHYTVQSGDTLWSIAKKYEVSMEGIVAVNYLSNKDVLTVGQQLEIPAIGGLQQREGEIKKIEYTVVKGDTLWSIAQQHEIKMHEIISINQLDSITTLSVGQKLNIPAYATVSAPKQETTSTAVVQKDIPKDIAHYVQKGDTLWGISRKYQVSLQSITSANRISENSRLVVGQKLVIPNVRNSTVASRSFMWPIKGLITSQFGMRTLGGRRDYHTGIDIDGHTGDPIRSAERGKVSFSGYINGYGYAVIIEHSGGYSTVYAHNSSNLVREGQTVSKGDIVAKLGATGNSTGSHLHFEIRKDGKPVNPLPYLK